MFKSPAKAITLFQTILMVVILYPGLYTGVTVILFLLCLARLIIKIGNGSFFLELLHVYAAFSCLLMPLVGYKFYDEVTTLILWVRKMPIPPEEYFAFNIPAVICMGWGFFFYRNRSSDDRPVIKSIIQQLEKRCGFDKATSYISSGGRIARCLFNHQFFTGKHSAA